jgi:alpha-glucosidase (family GH31 glycosyl hydrolase)
VEVFLQLEDFPALLGGQSSKEVIMVIKIKKANRGKFTAKAKRAGMSVPSYARKVLKKGSHASASTRKQANFARNARKWHHKGR